MSAMKRESHPARQPCAASIADASRASIAALHELFAHPSNGRLRWQPVLSLLESLGASHTVVSSSHEERIKLGSTAIAVPHLAHSEYASAPTLAALRKLIKDAGYAPHDACDHVSAQPASLHGKVVVCVTTRDARLYRLDGDEGEEATVLHAADPRSRRHHLHIKHGDRGKAGTPAYHGDWAPVPEPAFLASIAAALKDAESLIIVSHGKGKSDAALALEKHLASHAPSVAAKVAGHAHVSEGHVTHREIMAAGRQFFNLQP